MQKSLVTHCKINWFLVKNSLVTLSDIHLLFVAKIQIPGLASKSNINILTSAVVFNQYFFHKKETRLPIENSVRLILELTFKDYTV